MKKKKRYWIKTIPRSFRAELCLLRPIPFEIVGRSDGEYEVRVQGTNRRMSGKTIVEARSELAHCICDDFKSFELGKKRGEAFFPDLERDHKVLAKHLKMKGRD